MVGFDFVVIWEDKNTPCLSCCCMGTYHFEACVVLTQICGKYILDGCGGFVNNEYVQGEDPFMYNTTLFTIIQATQGGCCGEEQVTPFDSSVICALPNYFLNLKKCGGTYTIDYLILYDFYETSREACQMAKSGDYIGAKATLLKLKEDVEDYYDPDCPCSNDKCYQSTLYNEIIAKIDAAIATLTPYIS